MEIEINLFLFCMSYRVNNSACKRTNPSILLSGKRSKPVSIRIFSIKRNWRPMRTMQSELFKQSWPVSLMINDFFWIITTKRSKSYFYKTVYICLIIDVWNTHSYSRLHKLMRLLCIPVCLCAHMCTYVCVDDDPRRRETMALCVYTT